MILRANFTKSLVNKAYYSTLLIHTKFDNINFVGLYSYAFEYERKDSCIVCAAAIKQLKLSKSMLLKDLIQSLCDDISLQLKKPSVVGEGMIM